MTELSRRSFLIGTAAAMAAASLPVLTADTTIIEKIKEFPYRSIFDVAFSGTSEPSICEIFRRPEEKPFFAMPVGLGGVMRWVAMPYCEMIFLEGHVFEARVTPTCAGAELYLMYYIDPPKMGPLVHVEAHWQEVYDTDDLAIYEDYSPDYEPKVIGQKWIEAYSYHRRRVVSESYMWRSGELASRSVAPLDIRDSDLVL